MITLAWYLLKVIICSGILCSYYFLALRNKAFHRWNRFYLLAAVVISLVAPVIKIDIFQNNDDKGTVVQMLQTISYGDETVVEYSRNNGFQIDTQNLAEAAYLLISVIFLFIFFVSVYKIRMLRKKFPETKIEDISFINTNAKGTPFSFFKSIFWNNAIDLHSRSGQQIFNHEIAHVKEKHSYDKIFMNLVLIFFWINPFFWLMRKELYMIHEFIADKEALEDSDITAFAEMILQTVYPGQNFSIGNSFFYSPVKRRIMMLTKNKNPKVSYYNRLLVLPLAAIVFFAFTLKVNSSNPINSYNGKKITVVIDAGHGGTDNGAHSANGLKEKDITLSIAKKIAALNSSDHINILLSRDNDQSISVRDRVHFAKNHDADLFVSIHVNAAADQQLNGFSVLIDRNNTEKNQLLASAIIDQLKGTYKTDNEIEVRNRGLVVVDSNACPVAVIQCGYLSNSNDAAFISNDVNQEKIARNILTAINNYAIQNSLNQKIKGGISDTTPVLTLNLENSQFVDSTIKIKGKTSSVLIVSKDKSNNLNREGLSLSDTANPIYYVDGKQISKDEMKNISPANIQSVIVLKGKSGEKKYGSKGKNGVIEITTKNENGSGNVISVTTDSNTSQGNSSLQQNDTAPTLKLISKVFTKTEIPASFPGGQEAWQQYITRQIQASLDSFTNADFGTCVVKFIVGLDGSVIGAQATTMKGTHLAEVAVNAIKNGPKWLPAKQNGHDVAAYRLQPVTLANPGNYKKSSGKSDQPIESTSQTTSTGNKEVFLKLEEPKVFLRLKQPVSFPGR